MPQKQSHSFVPVRPTVYRPCKKKLSLFGVPKDTRSGDEKRLKENTAMCELHFGERYISRHIEHTVNGGVVSIYRGRPRLPPEAVPTQFPIFRSTSRNNFPEQEVSSEKRALAVPPSNKNAKVGTPL